MSLINDNPPKTLNLQEIQAELLAAEFNPVAVKFGNYWHLAMTSKDGRLFSNIYDEIFLVELGIYGTFKTKKEALSYELRQIDLQRFYNNCYWIIRELTLLDPDGNVPSIAEILNYKESTK